MFKFVKSLNLRSTFSSSFVNAFIIIAIIAVLICLLTSSPQWASSGTIELGVRVFVFDAVRCVPISDAQVLVFHSPPIDDQNSLDNVREHFANAPINDWPIESRGTTNIDGFVTVRHQFQTGANHVRPISTARLNYEWVRVEVDGFGGTVVQVRPESRPSSELRQQGEIYVTVGLVLMEE